MLEKELITPPSKSCVTTSLTVEVFHGADSKEFSQCNGPVYHQHVTSA